ncbi:hypothetical protein OROMI_010683 [Orobanche minor]
MNTISEITPAKETWKLHVRVERLWTTYSPYNPTEKRSMELILLDAKGDKIQASIPKYLISKFEKLIKEGGFYRFTNFEIEQNNEDFIATRHPYRLKFHKFTSPRPAVDLPIPKYGFKFIPFAEFEADKCYAKLLVDVIAEVLSVGDIVELNKNGQQTKRVTIHLQDSIGDTIECTLWNNYADQMVNYWKSKDGPVCVILQYAMVKDFRRVKCLQNSMFATRMLINEEVRELADFMNSIKENSDARHVISKQSLSHGSDAQSDDFSPLLQFKSISELDSTMEECCCLIIAKILNIHTNYNWFYDACNKCFKKVSVLDKSYWCEKCKMRPTSVLTRYKVHVRVEDESGTTSFVLFDHQVSQILGKSAADLKQALDLAGEDDSFPDELEQLIDKKFLFKLEISNYTLQQRVKMYTVLKMSRDEQIMSKFNDRITCASKEISGPCNEIDASTISSICDSGGYLECTPPSRKRVVDNLNAIDIEDDAFESQHSTTLKKIKVKVEKCDL